MELCHGSSGSTATCHSLIVLLFPDRLHDDSAVESFPQLNVHTVPSLEATAVSSTWPGFLAHRHVGREDLKRI